MFCFYLQVVIILSWILLNEVYYYERPHKKARYGFISILSISVWQPVDGFFFLTKEEWRLKEVDEGFFWRPNYNKLDTDYFWVLVHIYSHAFDWRVSSGLPLTGDRLAHLIVLTWSIGMCRWVRVSLGEELIYDL